MRSDWRIWVALLGGLTGCPSEPRRDVADAAAIEVDAGRSDAGGQVLDAGPPAPLRLEFAVSVGSDGGEEPVSFVDGAAEIDPVSVLVLTTPVRLSDYRVRLFDWADQVVVSDDSAAPGDAGVVYRIALPQPLKTGRRYSLVVDAERAPEISDEAGRHYDDVRLSLKIRGEIQPDTPAKKPGKKRK
ncbi:MAG: hypothetical protein AB1938_00675 [Myxococcota bacterium]